MRSGRGALGLAALLCATVGLPAAYGQMGPPHRASLATVEGTVLAVEAVAGEGGAEVSAVRLRVDEPEQRELSILLAPEAALREIGFEVEPGDRLRARIFVPDAEPVPAHKVLNLSRGMMVRLRTLMRIPVWDSDGQWQGGPCRNRGGRGGMGGPRHRGSGGPRN